MAGFHAAHTPPAVKFKGASRKSESGLRLEPWAPPHRSVADAPGVTQAGPEHGPAPPAQNVACANGRLSAPTCPLASQEKARCYGRWEERSSQPGGGILQTLGPDVPAGSCGDMPQAVVPTTSLCAKPVAGTPERKRPKPREPPAGSPRARRGSRRRR